MRVAARTVLRWLALGLVCAGTAGCVSAGPDVDAPLPFGDREVTLGGPDAERTAAVLHPETAGAGSPLVIVLHGAGGDGGAIRDLVDIDGLARRDGFVVAYPDALDSRWNAGICCRTRNMPEVDDVAFLHDLRERLIIEDRVDPGRVYAIGMSNGGMLSYTWACDRPGDLAGIGVVAAALVTDCLEPSPLTVVAVHGTADTVVPLGGREQGQRRLPTLDETLSPFRVTDQCPPAPDVEEVDAATVSTWNCATGYSVVQAVIPGARHFWPGSGREALRGAGDPRDATEFIWRHLVDAS